MTEGIFKCMGCLGEMLRLPTEMHDVPAVLDNLAPYILTTMEVAARTETTVEIFLCPGCGDQSAIFGGADL